MFYAIKTSLATGAGTAALGIATAITIKLTKGAAYSLISGIKAGTPLMGTFACCGMIAGTVAGGFAGAAVADAFINGSTKDFTDSDGNFMKTKAKHFKTTSVISGAGLGAGATALLTFGLASNPIGWTILGVGVAAGFVAWGIKAWWK